MTNFFTDGPLYVTGWMDTGPLSYFSVAPPMLVLAALAVPLVVGLAFRSVGVIVAGGGVLVGSLFMMGLFLPLELWGGLAVLVFLLGGGIAGWRKGRSGVLPLVVGGLVIGVAVSAGFPRSFVFNSVACRSNMKNISTGLEMWKLDHKGEAPDRLQDLIPNYFRTLPTCHGKDYVYENSVVWCSHELHQQVDGTPPGYPRIDEEGTLLKSPGVQITGGKSRP